MWCFSSSHLNRLLSIHIAPIFIYLFGQNTFESVAFAYMAKTSVTYIQEDGNKNHIFKMVLRACYARFKNNLQHISNIGSRGSVAAVQL